MPKTLGKRGEVHGGEIPVKTDASLTMYLRSVILDSASPSSIREENLMPACESLVALGTTIL